MDGALFLFLTFLAVDKILVKFIVLIVSLIFFKREIQLAKLRHIPAFYWLIPAFEVVRLLLLQSDFSPAHIIIWGIGMAYWIASGYAFLILWQRTQIVSSNHLFTTLDNWYLINAVVSFSNLIWVMVVSGSWNPYGLYHEAYGNSTGDYIKGLLLGPSYINMFINSYFAFFYLYHRRYARAIVATIICLLTSSNFANLIFFPVLTAHIFWVKSTHLRLLIAGVFLCIVGYYIFAAQANFQYMVESLRGDKDQHLGMLAGGGKKHSLTQTLGYLQSSPEHLLIGAGIGNFSSRLALSASDVDVSRKSRVFAHLPTYVHPDFRNNHYRIYDTLSKMPGPYYSTRHLPTSTANQILGEYGLYGLCCFLVGYIWFFIQRWRQLSYTRPIIVVTLGYFMFDYLFEYLSVLIFLELFFLIDLKRQPLAAPSKHVA